MTDGNFFNAGLAAAENAKGLPPVHLWNPDFCGDIDMRIARDGVWFYNGGPIGRQRMVRLFSRILKREGDEYFLVTPVEKVRIQVEDAPFIAVAMEKIGDGPDQTLAFTTNVGDRTTAGSENPLRMDIDPETEEPSPYVHVRAGLWARLARPVYYELFDLLETRETDGPPMSGVSSGGAFFPFISAEALAS